MQNPVRYRNVGVASCAIIAILLAFALTGAANAITPLPRIKARPASPAGEFYNTATNAVFHPVGSNYIRLDTINGVQYHSTFTTGFYNPSAADNALRLMHTSGYNVVRVFIDPGDAAHQALGEYGTAGPASSNTPGLYAAYMNNFIDFLERATNYGVYVIPVLDYVPYNAYYEQLVDSGRPSTITGVNSFYLYAGAVSSKTTYVNQFVQAVKAADSGVLQPTVFAYELMNEAGCETADAPFNMTSGFVTTQDGNTYNMALPADRQNCQDSNTDLWAEKCVDAIHSVDPDAMMSCSVYTFAAVGKSGPNGLMPIQGADNRYPARPMWLARTRLSFVDIHQYPTSSAWSITSDLNSSEFSSIDKTAKPTLTGECGANTLIFPDINSATSVIAAQVSAAKSIGIAGLLLWTWDDDSEPYWTALDNNAAMTAAFVPRATESPYNGTPVQISATGAATIEAENYDRGGEGIAYHSAYSSNPAGSAYRSPDSVAVYDDTAAGNGHGIGWTTGGEWQKYMVNVATAGAYTIAIRVSSTSAISGAMHVSDTGGANLSGSINVPNTGGWIKYQSTATVNVSLTAGPHTLQLMVDNGGYNIDSIVIGAPLASGTKFNQGQYLTVGQYITSPSKNCFLVQQSDGNLCLYKGSDPSNNQGFLWGSLSASQPTGNYFTILQSDGNLVTYKGTGPSNNLGYVWANFTSGSNYLQVTDSQQIQMISGNNVLWQKP